MSQRCGMLGIPRSEQDQIGKGPARPYLPGRLLEGAGNRAPRGMTIDALRALQNPAYRPALVGKTPSQSRKMVAAASFVLGRDRRASEQQGGGAADQQGRHDVVGHFGMPAKEALEERAGESPDRRARAACQRQEERAGKQR